VWRSMIDRRHLPTHHAWKNYGGRGIPVCKAWHTFEGFRADMGPSYRPGLTLDRIDVNGVDTPASRRRVSHKKHIRKRRNNRYIQTPWGRMTVSEASERSGIGVTTLLYRLNAGVPANLLFQPPDVTNRFTTS